MLLNPTSIFLLVGSFATCIAFTVQPIPRFRLRIDRPQSTNSHGDNQYQDTNNIITYSASKSRIHSSAEADFAPSDIDAEFESKENSGDYEASSSGGPSTDYEAVPNGLGEWEEMHGNYVLRPPATTQEPR